MAKRTAQHQYKHCEGCCPHNCVGSPTFVEAWSSKLWNCNLQIDSGSEVQPWKLSLKEPQRNEPRKELT